MKKAKSLILDKNRIRKLSSRALPPAIVLGLSSGGVAAARSLAKRGIPIIALSYDQQQPGIHTRCGEVLFCPNPITARPQFIGFLNELCEDLQQPSPVIISADAYVDAITNSFGTLSEKMILPFSRKTVGITDKLLQVEAAIRAGVGVPKTLNATGGLADRAEMSGLLPAIVKGRQSFLWQQDGMPKTVFCNSLSELDDTLSVARKLGAQGIVQNAIRGPVSALTSACVFIDPDGRLAGTFCMRKVRALPGNVGSYVKSEEIPALIESTVSLCRELKYWGMAEVEYKWDSSDSIWKMIELNPRLWEQTALAVVSGVDFPFIIYQTARGIPVSFLKFKGNLYWQDFFEDLYLARKTGLSATRVLSDFMSAVRPHLLLRDPSPAIHHLIKRLKDFISHRLYKLLAPGIPGDLGKRSPSGQSWDN